MVTVWPLTVRPTVPGRHVLEVRGFSDLQRSHCSVEGFIYSPPFTVGGLDWAIRYYPDGDDDLETGGGGGSGQYMSVFIELMTRGATVWARVGLGLIDPMTGETVPVLRAKDPILFDADCEDSSNWGTGELAWSSHLHAGSRFVRDDDDRLRIQITIHPCHDRLTFDDPPSDAWLGGDRDPDVILDAAGETFPAHAAVLHARAPGMMDMQWTGRIDVDGKQTIYLADDMPASSFKALLIFIYTDTLPVVAGLDGAGYKQMIRHLLVTAKRYYMERLEAICERVLCKSLDVDTVVETLAMADRHGFQKLSRACVRFMESPYIRVLLSPKAVRDQIITISSRGSNYHHKQ